MFHWFRVIPSQHSHNLNSRITGYKQYPSFKPRLTPLTAKVLTLIWWIWHQIKVSYVTSTTRTTRFFAGLCWGSERSWHVCRYRLVNGHANEPALPPVISNCYGATGETSGTPHYLLNIWWRHDWWRKSLDTFPIRFKSHRDVIPKRSIQLFWLKSYTHYSFSPSQYHQEFQVPKMEVLNLVRLFWWWVFPYISLIYSLFPLHKPYIQLI